ncbi:ABC transporter [Burkholderia sp. CF099]|jgi:ABC-type sugar transport system ATPase subunit|nr:ABC transporter [Burkholderia sp. CF099]
MMNIEASVAPSTISAHTAHELLQLDGITVEFGATRALDNVSFNVSAEEVVGLMGANGAGKSTQECGSTATLSGMDRQSRSGYSQTACPGQS